MLAGKTFIASAVGAVVVAGAILTAFPETAHAQCTTCSPLSLPSGSLVGQDLATARQSTFSLVGQATTGWVGFPNQVADNKPIQTRDSARFDLFLTTLQVSALHKSGFGVDALLPFGLLQSRAGSDRRTDVSFGDAEIKPRATTLIGRSLRLTGLAGAALPTGSYTAHSGPGALGDAARAVTIGRGVFWGIAEVEARVEPVRERLAVTAGTQGRLPIGEASDGFQWGPELRTLTEVEARPFSKNLGLAVGGELQIRGTGSQIDPFLNQRVESSNVGAKIVSITPAVRAQLDNGLFFSVTGRIPVYQDLTGLQFQQGPGVFAGAGYVFPVGVSAPSSTTTTASAKYIVREYGAEWCEACKKLAPLLEAQRTSRSDVRIEQVDVTQWSEDELARRVPGAKALPIVEVLRHDGSLIARLEGDRAFSFSDHLSKN